METAPGDEPEYMLERQEDEPAARRCEGGPVEYLDILRAVGPDDCAMLIESLEKTVEDLKHIIVDIKISFLHA